MKRKTKNSISIVIILLLCGSIVFTGYLSTKLSNTNTSNTMPTMNNGSQPPEMPNANNQGEPPEKPDGQMNEEQGNGNSNMEEPPERPNGDNTMGTPPEMPSNTNSMEPMKEQLENNTGNQSIYLVLFGIESLLLSSIVLYLVMSKFSSFAANVSYSIYEYG